ncbi:MAG: type II toxin-antitoxin system RelE/ParE family toxin [Bacteriovoracaceae bacterium]|nr:type II toxin-antitoxin system RelE/ParE family toxin [Bacteriovoracaceae bacterium]
MKRIDEDFLIYDGEHFEIEFYYEEDGEISIWDDFVSLSEKDQLALLVRLGKLGDSKPGVIHPKTMFNLEDDKNKIWAIKFGSNRFCSFFYDGGKIIITNAYKKQTQKNGKREIAQIKKASKMKLDYEKRVKKNDYYLEGED